MSQPNFPVRKKTPLDEPGLRLVADTLENGTGRPTLKVYPNGKNSLRFDIWTNLPGDKNDGRISADVPYIVMYTFLELIRQYAEPSTPADRSYIELTGFTFFGGKKSDKPEVLCKLFAGKDEQGVVFISIQVSDSTRPKIMFPLLDQSFSRIVTAQGPMNKAASSQLYARGYTTALQLFIQHHCSEAYVDKSANKQQGGGGGYGNNNGGGGGYGNKQGGNSYGNNNGGGSAPAPAAASGEDSFW